MSDAELLQYRAVFFDAADAMLILDDRRSVVEANTAACTLFAVPHDAIVLRSFDELITDEGEAAGATWRELMALGEAKREHAVRRSNGARLVECSYRARVHGDRHLCIARDITERRALEERVAQSEKIESVGRLAGGIAHDFNNLLTAILGYTELLLSQRSDGDADRPDLEEIQRAGQRAAALTQQLLAFSRKQVLLPKDVDLNVTVTGLQGMLTRLIREDITLTCQLSSEPAVVRIDPVQLEQVILNLVLNARDALPAGGQIRLEVAREPGEFVRLRVIDTGVGLSPEARAHLFEPFFTTKEVGKGPGLGLASVYGIVRQSNGSIAVDSEPGRGTTFTMHFPATGGAHRAEALATAAVAPPTGRETILLVEDEDSVRVIIGAVLRRKGYRVLEASDARVACDLFARHGRAIDLLLTDVIMPGVNGPALAQRLIGERPELRVLFISGYSDMAITLGSDNPNVGFLSKPFTASALAGRVREMLGSPSRTLEPVV
jgi:two-component system, cell cycle sensor histidine kinase and response regulator CckA